MKITYNWLKEFVDINEPAEKVAGALNSLGFEVNAVYNPSLGLSNIVTAQITEIKKHPQADKLKICIADAGEKKVQVVTAALNIKEGDIVPLALDGARLAKGLKIKKSKLRGEVSEGMFCSTSELGLTETSDGIWTLQEDLTIGKDAVKELFLDDWVIDYEITPNRPDALSVLGMARELSAYYRVSFSYPDTSYGESGGDSSSPVKIKIKDKKNCLRYTGIILKDVKTGGSPLFIQSRLLMCGQRPINNIVDMTNYALIELGHPLHSFDLNKISGGEIQIRLPKENEKEAVTLDGQKRKIYKDTLLICDSEKPVALAGVMGLLNSEVDGSTKDILIESAYFLPSSIRNTSNKLQLQTGASYIFERGADIEGIVYANKRCAYLMAEYCGCSVLKGVIDEYPVPYEYRYIPCDYKKIREDIGVNISNGEIDEILRLLNFEKKSHENKPKFKVPSYRVDISTYQDIEEETARLWGYDNIPEQMPYLFYTGLSRGDKINSFYNKLKDILTALGLYEAVNYSFVSAQTEEKMFYESKDIFKLINPISPETSVMRRTLFTSLTETLKINISRGSSDLCAFFEIGKVFKKTNGGLPKEEMKLGIILAGEKTEWYGKAKADFYYLKNITETLLNKLKIPFETIRKNIFNFHPYRAAEIKSNVETIGFLGQADKKFLKDVFNFKKEVFYAEIDLDSLYKIYAHIDLKYRDVISKFPKIERDLAFVMPRDFQVNDLLKVIDEVGGARLESREVFDIYTGTPLKENEKSAAVKMSFRDPDKTFSDEEANKIMNIIIEKAKNIFKIDIRK